MPSSFPLPGYATAVWLGPSGLSYQLPATSSDKPGESGVLPASAEGLTKLLEKLKKLEKHTKFKEEHERNHSLFPSPICRFCREEFAESGTELEFKKYPAGKPRLGNVIVRRISPKLTAKSKLVSQQTAEGLGL